MQVEIFAVFKVDQKCLEQQYYKRSIFSQLYLYVQCIGDQSIRKDAKRKINSIATIVGKILKNVRNFLSVSYFEFDIPSGR
jgi:hypothetical protein